MTKPPSGIDPAVFPEPFASQYRAHLQHLQLKGLRPKTIDAYARAMRRIGVHFQFEVSALSPAQLADYFIAMKAQHPWSGVKLDLYGLKFFILHVLGLRLGEGLALGVADIDADRMRVQAHNAKVGMELAWMQQVGRPPERNRFPVVLKVQVIQTLLGQMAGTKALLAALFDGCGLRLREALGLRVKDVDFERHAIDVRSGKGDKDRVVMLPRALVPRLQVQLNLVRAVWGRTLMAPSQSTLF